MELPLNSVTILRTMEPTDTILTSGLRLGRFFQVTWRLNCLFPVVALAFMWSMQDASWGLIAAGILLFSVILHEMAHLVAARTLGGDMEEIHLWPLGGLSHPHGRGYLSDHARVLFSGPLLNLLIALSCMTRLSSQQLTQILQNFTIQTTPDVSSLTIIIQFMFASNIVLFLVNLIPIVPFDAGVLLHTFLTNRFSEVEGRDLTIRVGLAMGIFGMLLGFVFDQAAIVAISAFLVVFHTHENMKWLQMLTDAAEFTHPQKESSTHDPRTETGTNKHHDEQSPWGPPLLHKSDHSLRESNESFIEDEDDDLHEEVLDEILEKLHVEGRNSLSPLEVALLEQLSHQIRQRRRSSL